MHIPNELLLLILCFAVVFFIALLGGLAAACCFFPDTKKTKQRDPMLELEANKIAACIMIREVLAEAISEQIKDYSSQKQPE